MGKSHVLSLALALISPQEMKYVQIQFEALNTIDFTLKNQIRYEQKLFIFLGNS